MNSNPHSHTYFLKIRFLIIRPITIMSITFRFSDYQFYTFLFTALCATLLGYPTLFRAPYTLSKTVQFNRVKELHEKLN